MTKLNIFARQKIILQQYVNKKNPDVYYKHAKKCPEAFSNVKPRTIA